MPPSAYPNDEIDEKVRQAVYRLALDGRPLTLRDFSVAAAHTVEIPASAARRAADKFAIRAADWLNRSSNGPKPRTRARSFDWRARDVVWDAAFHAYVLFNALLEQAGTPGSVVLVSSFVRDALEGGLTLPPVAALGPRGRPSGLAERILAPSC